MVQRRPCAVLSNFGMLSAARGEGRQRPRLTCDQVVLVVRPSLAFASAGGHNDTKVVTVRIGTR